MRERRTNPPAALNHRAMLTDCWLASGREANREGSQTEERSTFEETEIENDFQKECRKGAKFAAHTAFSVILGEISCLFSLALEFFTRFRGGSFQPLTHLSGNSCQLSAVSSQRKATANGGFLKIISATPPNIPAPPPPRRPFDDLDWGGLAPAGLNEARPPLGDRHHTPKHARQQKQPRPPTTR